MLKLTELCNIFVICETENDINVIRMSLVLYAIICKTEYKRNPNQSVFNSLCNHLQNWRRKKR